MSTQRLRASDVSNLAALIHECRDLGDDPFVWRAHFAKGLSILANPGLVVSVELRGLSKGTPHGEGAYDWGWAEGFDPRGWANACDLFANNPLYCASMTAFFERLRERRVETLARTDLLDDRTWKAVPERDAVFVTMGSDHHLFSFQPMTADTTCHVGLICFRRIGDRDYSVRERAIVAEATRQIAGLVGRSLARFVEPSVRGLSPRVREVLQCLLEGDGDKQIGLRLGIATYTVNQYTKKIF